MSGEAGVWLQYARENLRMAELALSAGLFNPCLQNAQQAVEKCLKAACLMSSLPLKRSHSIRELRDDLGRIGVNAELTDDECELLDSIYLPSKYPLGGALPEFSPDDRVARRCLTIAQRILSASPE